MTTEDTAAEKRTAVEYLNFGSKTAKRVAWESFEFTVIGPHLVKVTNASYGHLKDKHAYTVGVEEQDGIAVPAGCRCPADIHYEPDCKHKVALAAIGGPTVLNAAINYETSAGRSSRSNSKTACRPLTADGGKDTKICPNGDPTCPGPNADDDTLPCFPCYTTLEDA